MKQRLALALSLRGDPPLLVLDEVTASLDALGRHDFVAMLGRLSGEGRTMLFASHRIDEVASLARRVAVLDRGRLIEVLPVAEFIARRAADASGRSMLHLTIPEASRHDAVRALHLAGFAAELNGVGIVVSVQQERKAVPISVLADARVPVEDFEVVSLDATVVAAGASREVKA